MKLIRQHVASVGTKGPIPKYAPDHHNREIVGACNRKHDAAAYRATTRTRWIFSHQGDEAMDVRFRLLRGFLSQEPQLVVRLSSAETGILCSWFSAIAGSKGSLR